MLWCVLEETEQRMEESARTYLIKSIQKSKLKLFRVIHRAGSGEVCLRRACVNVVSRAGVVSCCRLVFGRALNAKSKSGQVAVSVFRQRIRSPLLRKARLWVTLVSKQLRAQLVQLVQLSRRPNCRAVEEAHVRAGFAGFESRKGGLM